jgi:hypothetical protein
MSAIALAWVASIKVGNQTAKQLLQFYAAHNFNKPGFEFKNKTLCEQLEVGERAIREAHKFLVDRNLIKRVPRYGKNGDQMSTLTYLLIPDSFVDNFFKVGGGGGSTCRGGGNYVPGGEDLGAPLYNNNLNNKKNIMGDEEKSPPTKKRKPQISIPEDFSFNDRHLQIAQELNIDINLQLELFKNHAEQHDRRCCCWDAAFRNWLKKAKDFNQIKKSIVTIATKTNESRSTVVEYGPGHPTWEANEEWKRKYGVNSHGSEETRNSFRGTGVQKASGYILSR